MMRKRAFLAASCLLVLAALVPAQAQEPSPAAPAIGPHIAAVGDMVCHRGTKEGPVRDIERYGICDAMAVSQLVVDGDYEKFLALGDLQYLRGNIERYRAYYDESFGRVKAITMPVAGNHEYYTRTDGMWGAGYYTYFGQQAHPPFGYYSTDIGAWHVVILNSQLCKEKSWLPRVDYVHGLPGDGCRPGDPQYEWLVQDLRDHPNSEYRCTLAAFHHPLYKWTEWPKRPTDRVQAPLWRLLRAASVDVVLNGHQHNYQRFEPMNARGEPSDKGMAEFIVGTGGDTYGPFPAGDTWDGEPKPAGLVAYEGKTYGILDLALEPTSYSWEFVTAEGHPVFEDTGTAQCR
jgi:hypothetical protein